MPAHTPPAARKAIRRDVVLGRITLARAGRWDLLANTAQREAERRAGQRARSQLPSSLAGRALANEAQRRLHKGEWRNAASLLQSRGIAPPTEDTRKDLAKKLKGGPEDLLLPRCRPVGHGAGVDRDALYRALSSAASTTAPGPSGLRFSHLQGFRVHPQAMFYLGVTSDRIADGDLPEAAVEYLALIKLTPLNKRRRRDSAGRRRRVPPQARRSRVGTGAPRHLA